MVKRDLTICRHHCTADFLCTVLFLDTSGISTPNGDFYAILNNDVYQYSPQKGDLLIFTSDVCHGTYPQVKGLRHTLNLDFNPHTAVERTTVNRLVPGSIPGRGSGT